MSKYEDYKRKALENPEVRAEYDALQPVYDLIQTTATTSPMDAAKLTEALEQFSDISNIHRMTIDGRYLNGKGKRRD